MADYSKNNKRIAKNTILLYARMLMLMLISLYTSRVNLQALGVADFGIYNVVGGVVAMFSLLSGSLSAATSRFITFELGKGDKERLKKVFSSTVTIQLILILIIVILLESIGLWLLNNKMVIPADRMEAANWLFQFSIISFAVNLWSIPYNAAIIAHEKMSAFAYISIFEASAKLAIAFLIVRNPFDRLIYFGLLILVVSLIIRFLYNVYCKKHFEECHYTFIWDKSILKEIFGFAGWNFIGASAVVLKDAGGNVLLNMFFGPIVNAARGIAMQVNGAVYGFVSNFTMALNPQITKNYALGNFEYMMKLVFQGARLSYYILLFICLPILVNTQYILELWLGQVPEHATDFVRLVLLYTMSESLASTLITATLATGQIKKYQILVGGCQLLNLPLSYFLLKLGLGPNIVFVVAIGLSIAGELIRVILLRQLIHLSARQFLFKVYFNVFAVTVVAAVSPLVLQHYMPEGFCTFLLLSGLCVLCCIGAILYVGCNKDERFIVYSKTKAVLKIKFSKS